MSGIRQIDGVLPSGGAWSIDVPKQWNGTLCVFSAGYGESGAGRVDNAGDPVTKDLMLRDGFALAGSRAARAGWAVEDTLLDQVSLVSEFRARVGAPDRTIAWGRSMGGLIAAALAQVAPDVFDGAVAMCASLAGPVPMLNQGLDAAFVLASLAFPDEDIALVGVEGDDLLRLEYGRQLVERAGADAAGRARLALASAVAQLPTWTSDNLLRHRHDPPEPAADDFVAKLAHQRSVFPYVAFSPRSDLERRAGGNFSWNNDVDYAHQLDRSGFAELVSTAYADAGGVSLESDLAKLEETPRVAADESAVRYMEQNITPDGFIGVPVLTVSITGDFAPTVSHAHAYAGLVDESGCSHHLRQVYVHAPGHCTSFSSAEILTAVREMDSRLRDGLWGELETGQLNDRARRIADSTWPRLRPPRFADFEPHPHVRPYPRGQRLTPLATG